MNTLLFFKKKVPKYIVDLDLPEEERWLQIADDYAHKFKEIEKTVLEELQVTFLSF